MINFTKKIRLGIFQGFWFKVPEDTFLQNNFLHICSTVNRLCKIIQNHVNNKINN